MKTKKDIRKAAAGIFCTAALALALAGCGDTAVMGSVVNDETGGFDVTAENAYGTTCSGSVSIAEGECLVVSPMLEKGHLLLTVAPEEELNAAIEDEPGKTLQDVGTEDFSTDHSVQFTVDGKAMSAYALEPGAYEVLVTAEKEKTTGTMAVLPRSIEELQAEDASLAEAIRELPIGSALPATEIQDLTAGAGATGAEAAPEGGEAPQAGASQAGASQEAAVVEDGQNPVMNFVGPYVWYRANALVEAAGTDEAKITVDWASSAAENTEWVMSGKFDPEKLTVEYSNCVRTDYVYNENGEIESQTVVFENGTGSITFREESPLTFVWEIDQEQFNDEAVFEWHFEAP